MADHDGATRQLELIESSFALLAPRGDELVESFYARLFEVAPAVRSMFPDYMAGQKRALLGALGMIVGSLRAPEKLGVYLGSLGERHVGYGALAPHYDVVGGVLLETLAEMAGDAWTDEMQDAWASAYGAIKGLMLAGAARTGHQAA
ncbi:MAG: globin family protein [Dehalococcoidia bacterium]